MLSRRVALPFPPSLENLGADAPDEALLEHLSVLRRERAAAAARLAQLELHIAAHLFRDLCRGTSELQDVETYDGTLGVSRDFVDRYQASVGQIQWLGDLSERFSGPDDSPGNVAGVRWGSGGLVGDDMFISAGHCFDIQEDVWRTPRMNGELVQPNGLATLMRVNFNYQLDGATGLMRQEYSYPITELIEYREGFLDYAIVRLGRNSEGRLPGEVYGILAIAEADVTDEGAMLCLIQHPNGKPKQIEAGPMLKNRWGRICYNSLDTLGGSSGSPILSVAGQVVGIHTTGGCAGYEEANYGVSIGAIKPVSSLLSSE